MKQNKYTKSAKGKPCALRSFGCSPGPSNETVVLAHLRRFGHGGMGTKPYDIHAIYACSFCHDLLDGRSGSAAIKDTQILRAMMETQQRMIEDGVINL